MDAADGDSQVITQIVTMSIKPEHDADFVEFASQYIDMVHAEEPGTTLYVLTEHPGRPHTYVWIERYQNEEALRVHSEAPSMEEAMGTLPAWWAASPELLRLSQVYPA